MEVTDVTLWRGNCLEMLREVPPNSVDLVILDLPYGETHNTWDKPIDLSLLWPELKRVGKEKTPYLFFCTTKYGHSLIQSNPSWFRYDMVWDKVNCTSGFLNARIRPLRNHEMIYVFYDRPFFNIDDNHTRIANVSYSKQTANVTGTNYNKTPKINAGHAGPLWEPKLPTSILSFPSRRTHKHQHPTEKSEDLIEFLVKYYSKSGDTVLDPAMGSGVTGVVCKRHGRNFLGIEIDTDMFDKAQERIYV